MPQEKTAVMTFGRMNPPTVGHEKLINKTIAHANSIGAKHYIFVSHSQDGQKNPLSGSEKASYIKKAIPGANVRTSDKSMPSFMHIAKHLHDQGHEHLVMVAGSDRVNEYHKKLNDYNGKPNSYNFKSIKVVSAGARDPDADGVEGMSGTKMREAAKTGDHKTFKSGLISGLSDKLRTEIYNKVRSAMGIKEKEPAIAEAKNVLPFLLMTRERFESVKSSQVAEEKDDEIQKPKADPGKLLKAPEDDEDAILAAASKDIDSLQWHDVFHLYDDDEVDIHPSVAKLLNEDILAEDLNLMQRIKKRIDFMRTEKRREIARKISLQRVSPADRMKRRATVAARNMIEKRLLAGQNKQDLSVSMKVMLEKRLNKLRKAQAVLATKLTPKLRDIEKQRLQRNEMVSFKEFVRG